MSENKIERKFIELLAQARYWSKRMVGISKERKDGSECTEENDIQATGAEYFASQHYGCPFNFTIDSKGDGGKDFQFKLDVEVIWMGLDKNGCARSSGHLIVNPDEPQRWADIYVMIGGTIESGFSVIGWTTHKKLIGMPKKDFGYGEKFAMHISDLYKTDLLSLKR